MLILKTLPAANGSRNMKAKLEPLSRSIWREKHKKWKRSEKQSNQKPHFFLHLCWTIVLLLHLQVDLQVYWDQTLKHREGESYHCGLEKKNTRKIQKRRNQTKIEIKWTLYQFLLCLFCGLYSLHSTLRKTDLKSYKGTWKSSRTVQNNKSCYLF